ncbi:hypothetical protein [Streptantibioticus cattleyicolor]|uniref:Uncharacterized protein n=1 Tax=Streptantibioticus cattleyicolor (strain ATCC 35852 / DSM 46488 / JCM 4925 / NBRC 14057 / NRRL 8057) TaxID=1003195 RepID=F8JN46_STREN|nr:hypothetical protein [Streptantibioticus cattleyicolor]AEW99202.1 hypothetical protein SCATT_p10090 [Streptantibioticus cattleyicolor NRRL 8057 = DSM 46488]CCB71754.1 protein of unknown function [Streptantibioticus cattleyicolor NRRL 8057 = DSM 46488]
MNGCSWCHTNDPDADIVLIGFEDGATIVGPAYYACRNCRFDHRLIPLAESPFTDGLPPAWYTDVLPGSKPDCMYACPPAPRHRIVRWD